MAFQELDGPAKEDLVSIGAVTPVRVKIGSVELSGRKVITIQPVTGPCRLYFADDQEVPSASTVLNKGFRIPKTSIKTFEASDTQWVYLISVTGTIDVIIAERG